MKYQQRSIEVTALQYDSNLLELKEFVGESGNVYKPFPDIDLIFESGDQVVKVSPKDYLVKFSKDEFKVISKEEFEKRFVAVLEEDFFWE